VYHFWYSRTRCHGY